jgi:hypothetical protein
MRLRITSAQVCGLVDKGIDAVLVDSLRGEVQGSWQKVHAKKSAGINCRYPVTLHNDWHQKKTTPERC